MTHQLDLRRKAREYRRERNLTIDEIAERLAVSRSTVYYWVKNMPPRKREQTFAQRSGTYANQERCRALRQAAYEEGVNLFEDLSDVPSFRDFVCMYIGEGSKRARGTVSLCNSDPVVVALATRWIRRFSDRKVTFSLQYHADQDPSELITFWAEYLNEDPTLFKLQRKSNSSQLAGRVWRSRHGVLTVTTNDTYFRAKLQAWMDGIREEWSQSVRPEHRGLS